MLAVRVVTVMSNQAKQCSYVQQSGFDYFNRTTTRGFPPARASAAYTISNTSPHDRKQEGIARHHNSNDFESFPTALHGIQPRPHCVGHCPVTDRRRQKESRAANEQRRRSATTAAAVTTTTTTKMTTTTSQQRFTSERTNERTNERTKEQTNERTKEVRRRWTTTDQCSVLSAQ